ncbi:MAG: octaprenyl diphosphate synthase [Gammaproteobacteria bacterium]|nr:octaprenyl diphosphate synthase [Gammaproteobacteria bacterium]
MFDEFEKLLAEPMRRVDQTIRDRLRSDVALINQLGNYIVAGGGKRLRPRLVLMAAGATGYKGDAHITVAAIVEFVHTATLLHDDVVDSSSMRRGQETANAVWGNEAAVLVGDFLYSRAFEMMVEVGSMRVMEILAHTTNTIAEGEVMQLLYVHDPDTTEQRYLEVIRDKTAKLFEAAAQLGGVLAGVTATQERSLSTYGLHLGQAFQLIDDVLDYSASAEDMGKNVGDDLAEGKPTLPLIVAMQRASPADAALLREAIERGGGERLERVVEIVRATGALELVRAHARQQADRAREALRSLPPNRYVQALGNLAEFAVRRGY